MATVFKEMETSLNQVQFTPLEMGTYLNQEVLQLDKVEDGSSVAFST